MVPVGECAHRLIERQAARTPHAGAIEYRGQVITYRELDERSSRLAHALRRRGVGRDVLVGVCFERTPEMMVALLASWKAGGAYVPLDPAYPAERLAYMLDDCNARVLLTEEKYRGLFPAGAPSLCLDSEWDSIAAESAQPPTVADDPSGLAYVMYTSGSTGRPKGAMIEHRGLANYLVWATAAYGVREGDWVPVHSSISFDLTVTSLFPALTAGGSVALLPDGAAAQPLLEALRRRSGSALVKITPAHLDLLAQQVHPGEAARLTRCFVIGGEQLTAESLRFWRTHAPATRLVNEYGPTETVVGCCVHEVGAADPHSGAVPIGRAIDGMRMHLVDGEICIGGIGVGRGYLGRADLTAERFIADPFSAAPEARLYRTGDLGRVRTDGIFEYLGRADHQVKIRGYRIEPGEIEHVLCSHPEVQTCAVVARTEPDRERWLAAYVVPRPGRAPDAHALKKHLAARLPAHMLPAQIAFLGELPLTVNGKVDRKALQSLAPQPAAPTQPAAAPRTPTETALLALWRELLEDDSLGVDDDFFARGAHSLMAMRAVVRIRDELKVDVPLRNLFEHPSIAALAAIVERLALGAPATSAHDPLHQEIAL